MTFNSNKAYIKVSFRWGYRQLGKLSPIAHPVETVTGHNIENRIESRLFFGTPCTSAQQVFW